MKLVLGDRHLNARIWHFKRRRLAFTKLTPGRGVVPQIWQACKKLSYQVDVDCPNKFSFNDDEIFGTQKF